VYLREVAAGDAHSLFTLITDDPKVDEYISPPPPSEGAFAGFIDWSQRERAAGRGVCFAVVPHGLEQAVGLFQVRALEPTFFTAEWGFALGSSFWSTGMFEEAATLVADFAFDVLGAFRIEGRAATVNGRGNGALTKIGAVSEAILKDAFGRDGTWHEQLLWSIIREEWKERRTGARERISVPDAQQRIQQAIREFEAQLAATAPPKPPGRDPLYPFFISGRPPRS
jgi:ribosomal-protein-alanine N-acetyltransferase